MGEIGIKDMPTRVFVFCIGQDIAMIIVDMIFELLICSLASSPLPPKK
jgi:hypothetical protein